ncbi:hypothetical protein B0H11DRAFT_2228610 [Mycena galericulata]|nr:hypothetical protein B0H11DRAFT_2228610 [Mycena galericulata]
MAAVDLPMSLRYPPPTLIQLRLCCSVRVPADTLNEADEWHVKFYKFEAYLKETFPDLGILASSFMSLADEYYPQFRGPHARAFSDARDIVDTKGAIHVATDRWTNDEFHHVSWHAKTPSPSPSPSPSPNSPSRAGRILNEDSQTLLPLSMFIAFSYINPPKSTFAPPPFLLSPLSSPRTTPTAYWSASGGRGRYMCVLLASYISDESMSMNASTSFLAFLSEAACVPPPRA